MSAAEALRAALDLCREDGGAVEAVRRWRHLAAGPEAAAEPALAGRLAATLGDAAGAALWLD
ncbi:hypothetical protein, partial [Azospirillum oleiclasticum]